jgi:hypothetical protein
MTARLITATYLHCAQTRTAADAAAALQEHRKAAEVKAYGRAQRLERVVCEAVACRGDSEQLRCCVG